MWVWIWVWVTSQDTCTRTAESCAWDEHFCDHGLCIHLGFVCDGFHDCEDRSDEANCSVKHKGGMAACDPPGPGEVMVDGNGGTAATCVCAVCVPRVRGAADRPGGAPLHPEPPPAIPTPAGERRDAGRRRRAGGRKASSCWGDPVPLPGFTALMAVPVAVPVADLRAPGSRHRPALPQLQPGVTRGLQL